MSWEPDDAERARIVGLCARITGDPDAAEDLAQQVLFEAWRSRHGLREPSKRREWLSGIARNVCRRWGRHRGRETAIVTTETHKWREEPPDAEFDLEDVLERSELARLVDRALGEIPESTREVLVSRLIEEVPQREVAERLGISEAVVGMRLERGKRMLRRILLRQSPEEVAAHRLLPPEGLWEETRIWCPFCGTRKLEGRFSPDRHHFAVRCPGCGGPMLTYSERGEFAPNNPSLFDGVRGYKPALSRALRHSHELHELTSADPVVPCSACGKPTLASFDPERLTVLARCDRCGSEWSNGMPHLALALPEALAFWREHQRVRTLPPREMESHGEGAAVVSIESLTSNSRRDVVLIRRNLAVVGVHSERQGG